MNNDDEHGLCVNDYMLRCLSGQLYAIGANITNIVLSIIAPISRNMITAIYGYDKSENNQLKDKKILTATSNTFGSPVEKFLSFSVDRLFKLADEASEDVNPMSFFEEGLTV
ncbi:MAG: hypothetical protein Q8R83_08845 [Legionellaceae bacterium]|nr:hypothetical protein [Legionellaceae bacterium]